MVVFTAVPIYSQIEVRTDPERTGRKEDRLIEPAANTWKNQDGEFELVLGNKQLLSVFFFIVILLAVFFVMGYMVGRSTGGDLAAKRPIEPITRTDTTSAMPKASSPTKPLDVPQVTKSDAVQETTPTAQQQTTPATSAVTKETTKPIEVPPVTTSVTQPVPGNYVQVTAPMRPEGELIVEVLGKKGFHAILAPGPDEKRFRVLVGPLNDASETGKTISDLEKIGFKGAFPRHY